MRGSKNFLLEQRASIFYANRKEKLFIPRAIIMYADLGNNIIMYVDGRNSHRASGSRRKIYIRAGTIHGTTNLARTTNASSCLFAR